MRFEAEAYSIIPLNILNAVIEQTNKNYCNAPKLHHCINWHDFRNVIHINRNPSRGYS